MSDTEELQYGECCCCLEKGDHRELTKQYYLGKRPEIYEVLFKDTFDIVLKYPEATKLICDCCIVELRGAHYFRFMVKSSQQRLGDRVNWQPEFDIGDKDPEIKSEPEDYLEDSDNSRDIFEHKTEEPNNAALETDINEEKSVSDPSSLPPVKLTITRYNCKIPKVLLIRSSTVDQSLSYDKSQYRSAKKNSLKKSRTRIKEKTFSCNICPYKGAYRYSVVNHMKTHTGEKPFSCELCPFKTAHNSALSRHRQSHRSSEINEETYSCKFCQYKTIHKGNLATHSRTHTGEKPFTCEICKYKVARKGNLARHMRTHTGEKPYSCDLCHYKAVRKVRIIEHMRTHTGDKPYSCDSCQYKSAQKRHLVEHIRTHTRKRFVKMPYTCDVCQYETTRKELLAKHIHKVHPAD